MIGALFGDLIPYALAALGALVGVLAYGKAQRQRGASSERAKRHLEDLKEANEVKEKVDAASRDGDAVERLRKRGKLRD